MTSQHPFKASVLLLTGKLSQQQQLSCFMQTFPGPEFSKYTRFVMIEGRTFVSAEFQQQQLKTKEAQLEAAQQQLLAAQAQLQSAKVAMGVSKEALLTALEDSQMHTEMLQEYVLTLAHALLLTADKRKRALLEDGSTVLRLNAAEMEALDTALDCIRQDNGDTDNEENLHAAGT